LQSNTVKAGAEIAPICQINLKAGHI